MMLCLYENANVIDGLHSQKKMRYSKKTLRALVHFNFTYQALNWLSSGPAQDNKICKFEMIDYANKQRRRRLDVKKTEVYLKFQIRILKICYPGNVMKILQKSTEARLR